MSIHQGSNDNVVVLSGRNFSARHSIAAWKTSSPRVKVYLKALPSSTASSSTIFVKVGVLTSEGTLYGSHHAASSSTLVAAAPSLETPGKRRRLTQMLLCWPQVSIDRTSTSLGKRRNKDYSRRGMRDRTCICRHFQREIVRSC